MCDMQESVVPRGVTILIIDALEMVDVDQQQRDRVADTRGAFARSLVSIAKGAGIEKPRQRIVFGKRLVERFRATEPLRALAGDVSRDCKGHGCSKELIDVEEAVGDDIRQRRGSD